MAVAQHHDAVAITSKQHVANDYVACLSCGSLEVWDEIGTNGYITWIIICILAHLFGMSKYKCALVPTYYREK